MVLKCNVKGCRKNSAIDKDHSFFRLPQNPQTREKWLEFAGVSADRSHVRICTDHFDETMIRKKYPRPLLTQDAVPTIRRPAISNTDRTAPEGNADDRGENQEPCVCKPDPPNPEKVSAPQTQIININVNNVSSIVISGKDTKIIVNIVNNEANKSTYLS